METRSPDRIKFRKEGKTEQRKTTNCAEILTVTLVSSSPSVVETEKRIYSVNKMFTLDIFICDIYLFCFVPVTVGEYSCKLFLISTGLSDGTGAPLT